MFQDDDDKIQVHFCNWASTSKMCLFPVDHHIDPSKRMFLPMSLGFLVLRNAKKKPFYIQKRHRADDVTNNRNVDGKGCFTRRLAAFYVCLFKIRGTWTEGLFKNKGAI